LLKQLRHLSPFSAETCQEYFYPTPFLAAQKATSPNTAPRLGLTVSRERLTDKFLTKQLVGDGFGGEEVVAKKTDTHITAVSLSELVGGLMLAKAVLTPDYPEDKLKEIIPTLRKEGFKFDGYKTLDIGVELHGTKPWTASATN